MSVLGGLWHYAVPALLVLGCAAALVSAVREPLTPWRFARWEAALLALTCLVLVADAAFAANRPPLERAWKAAAVALVVVTVLVTRWARDRARKAARR